MGERVTAISAKTPPPCVDCMQRYRCGVEKLACYDFAKFAQCVPQGSGRPPVNRRLANKRFYGWAFGAE